MNLYLKKINRELLKKSFIYTFILGLISHAYCFLNFTISHDSLGEFYAIDKWHKAELGRIFYPIYISITRGRIVNTWLIGVISLSWISFAVYLLSQMFKLQKNMWIFSISAILVTNPTVYSIASAYIHDLDANMFAMLLSVYAAFLWNKATTHKYMKMILLSVAVLSVYVSLGIYQSYVSVTISLMIIISIKDILEGRECKGILLRGGYGIAVLIFAALLYLGSVKVFSAVTTIPVLEYESYNSLGNIKNVLARNIFDSIYGAYIEFFVSIKNIVSAYPKNILLFTHYFIALGILGISMYGIKKNNWNKKILFVILGVLLPLGMNVSYIMSGGLIHDLMKYSFWFIYLLAVLLVVWLYEQKEIADIVKKGSSGILIILILIITANNIQNANVAYVKKDLERQATLAYMTRVVERMECQEGYIPGETPVIIIGEYLLSDEMLGFEKYGNVSGVGIPSQITSYKTYTNYFEYILKTPILLSDKQAIVEEPYIGEMPVFPQNGSIIMIGDTLVVKLK